MVLSAEILAEAIRANKEIKGITLHKKDHKISLYADDTTLLLKPHESNIGRCISILKEYEHISGLKVNKEKTKFVKIGAWRYNSDILCNDLKLDWTQEFTSLGITYDKRNFHKITDINIENKIIDIDKLIQIWNERNLTPYGKIIIIKSLLISKITHVLLSLPSPQSETFLKLENMFKSFIWGSKNAKFRSEILETIPTLGGLKLTNLKGFNASLKLSWFKRLLYQSEGWAEFPIKLRVLDILKYGDNFPKKIMGDIHNKFWKDVVRSVINLNENLKIQHNFAN